ncbi:hypothetical protein SAMN05216225_100852 [Ornithinibacillus halophilus]|uniref:Uncharacterized protein n=1 Tax=Ornithinibacillus halophilus TaxID=930117 RepID=A0A1M5FE48_9BACI|nr:hypothetical protein SAMN05216225_100852 [Ornithinibacillus halophilus]
MGCMNGASVWDLMGSELHLGASELTSLGSEFYSRASDMCSMGSNSQPAASEFTAFGSEFHRRRANSHPWGATSTKYERVLYHGERLPPGASEFTSPGSNSHPSASEFSTTGSEFHLVRASSLPPGAIHTQVRASSLPPGAIPTRGERVNIVGERILPNTAPHKPYLRYTQFPPLLFRKHPRPSQKPLPFWPFYRKHATSSIHYINN